LLAPCHDGCTEAMMLAHGFTIEQMVELVNAGLGTAKAERVVAGNRTIEVARLRITDGGGARALAGHDAHFTRMYHTPSSTDPDRILGRS
jgi:hypothetical protein